MPTYLNDPWIALDGDGLPAISSNCLTFSCFRYDPKYVGSLRYEFLPHVQFLGDAIQEGTDPGMASFRYIFGMDTGPQSFTQALDISYSGLGILNPGDRIIVRADRPDGVTGEIVWDGLVTAFDFEIGEDSEVVPFTSVGVARTLWDTPISGRLQRDANDPAVGEDREIALPGVFNPAGYGNCTPDGHDHEDSFLGDLTSYPVFIDERVRSAEYPSRQWTLGSAACYLIWHHNPDEKFVTNPQSPYLKDLLANKIPKDGVPFDPDDDSTYVLKPLPLPVTPIDGRDWPTVLYDIIRKSGYGMAFQVGTAPDGQPSTTLAVFAQQSGPIKDVWMQAEGEFLDPGLTNMFRAAIGRDVTNVVDRWEVRGAMERYEVDVVLDPLFPSDPGDLIRSTPDLERYSESHPDFYTTEGRSDKYRTYVADECGEGHYKPGSSELLINVPDFKTLLDPDDTGTMVVRRRPPIGELLTADYSGRPLRASLMISRDYGGEAGLWDGVGTWQEVQGGWAMLKDRLGIQITSENPNRWNIGDADDPSLPYPSGMVRGVEDQDNLSTRFWLKLTCCIDGDRQVLGVAEPSPRSASRRPVTRVVDARDRYHKDTITQHSRHWVGPDGDYLIRDDTQQAEYEAKDARNSTECGVLEGTVVIPYFTNYYRVGDRIRSVAGRGLSFRTDGGTDETPAYPVVVGVSHDCGGGQTTEIQISDAGTARKNYERRTRRRADGRL